MPRDEAELLIPRRSAILVSPALFRRVLFITTAVISLAGLTVEVLKSIYRWKGRSGVVPLLSLSNEQNVPTCYTALLLLLASSMSALLATSVWREAAVSQPVAASEAPSQSRPLRSDAIAYWGLAAGFFYISVDEVLELHEKWGRPFHTKGALYFGWVIPAFGILLVLAALYARFLWRLPSRLRTRLLIAGAVYVTGAVLMELPLGYWTDKQGQKNLEYALIDWVEETLEMTGIVLYLLTVRQVLADRGVMLGFGEPKEPPSPSQPEGDAP